MAAAYATVAGRGTYCSPVAIEQIVTDTGSSLAVPSANCHQVLSSDVADAVNYILQGVLTSGTAASPGGLSDRESAGKTGTSNVENGYGTPYAAFAGYTPSLVGYVSVFNPLDPVTHPMSASHLLPVGGLDARGRCSGRRARGTWQMTFLHADLADPAAGSARPTFLASSGRAARPRTTAPRRRRPGRAGGRQRKVAAAAAANGQRQVAATADRSRTDAWRRGRDARPLARQLAADLGGDPAAVRPARGLRRDHLHDLAHGLHAGGPVSAIPRSRWRRSRRRRAGRGGRRPDFSLGPLGGGLLARPAAAKASAASRRRFASLVRTVTTSSSLSSREVLPATSAWRQR